MKEYHLDFVDFQHHESGVLEVIVHQGVEITSEQAHQFLDTIAAIEPKVRGVLVNRKNPYSYTFKANVVLAASNTVEHVAVVKYSRLPWPLNGIMFPKFYRLAFFDNYDEAYDWLLAKLEETEEDA
ncbi:MAG: hypothetical protein OEY36_06550 [Gammaproteobacteria bacterium]|nr:hypothetical protein [Gammaproteobacteria bacterium]